MTTATPDRAPGRVKRRAWTMAVASSLVLLGLVLSQIDRTGVATTLQALAGPLVSAALALLLVEALVTSARLRLLALTHPPAAAALRANAWYSLLVLALPARLGEVAAIVVLERHLGQKRAAAFASIVVQRLLDVIVLGLVFLLTAVVWLIDLPRLPLAVGTGLLVGVAILVIHRLDELLALAARGLLAAGRHPGHPFRRRLLTALLQARRWSHRLDVAGLTIPAAGLTIVKWIATLAALALLLRALHAPLEWQQAALAAIAYCFLAAVPLHSLGGIGLGEVGLTALLVGMDVPVGIAAAVSLTVRAVLILFPVSFFGLVYGVSVLGGANHSGRTQ